MAQCVGAFAQQAEDWVFESHLRKTFVVKAANESSTAKRSANMCVSQVLGDDHYKLMSHVTVGVAR